MPTFVIVHRVVSFPVYEIEADTLEKAFDKLNLGTEDAVREPVDDESLVRCYKVVDGEDQSLSQEEVEFLDSQNESPVTEPY